MNTTCCLTCLRKEKDCANCIEELLDFIEKEGAMDKCTICSKETDGLKNAITLTRYGYSGPMMPLCKDCMKELINWIENRRVSKEFQVKENII